MLGSHLFAVQVSTYNPSLISCDWQLLHYITFIINLFVVVCHRVNGSSAKQMTEKALKYYPLSINYSGNLTAKSSYLVSIKYNYVIITVLCAALLFHGFWSCVIRRYLGLTGRSLCTGARVRNYLKCVCGTVGYGAVRAMVSQTCSRWVPIQVLLSY